jgi:hypothetical protein
VLLRDERVIRSRLHELFLHLDELDIRFVATKREVTLETLDRVTGTVNDVLKDELRALDTQSVELRNKITQRFAEYNRRWPAEAGGLDPGWRAHRLLRQV